MENKHILIIGGTGSLGYQLCKTYLDVSTNRITVVSRDECKHWKMGLDFNKNPRLQFVIGDIRNKEKMRQTLIRTKPNIIIMAAAMKHIDRCEYESNECIETNIRGTQNILDCIEVEESILRNTLEAVSFISTDKACSPVNIYGMSKAISEGLMIEKALYIKTIKFVTVRYGNVLNSRGSIIPTLHKMGKDDNVKNFFITDDRMTRFVMTLDQSVSLINHALFKAESGDIVIPRLISCNIKDMIELFSEKYNKPIIKKGIRPGEKMLESLINETQSLRLVNGENGYMYIKPCWNTNALNTDLRDYNSKINPLNKIELKKFLINLKLL